MSTTNAEQTAIHMMEWVALGLGKPEYRDAVLQWLLAAGAQARINIIADEDGLYCVAAHRIRRFIPVSAERANHFNFVLVALYAECLQMRGGETRGSVIAYDSVIPAPRDSSRLLAIRADNSQEFPSLVIEPMEE
jgi:hypothetical protein